MSTTQETHFQRMEKELADLTAKIERFDVFLESEKYQNCSMLHKELIKRQYFALATYHTHLRNRIDFEREHPEVQ